MAKKTGNQPAEAAALEWGSFLSLVGRVERDQMAEDLFSYQIVSYADYTRFCQRVAYYLVKGWLSPHMSAELRAWAEEAYTALTASAIRDQSQDRHIIDALEAAQEARQIEEKPPAMDEEHLRQLEEYRSRVKETP